MIRTKVSAFCLALLLAAPLSPALVAQEATDAAMVDTNAQGTNAVGVTARVKSVTISDDATVLGVVLSFDSQETNYVELAGGDTYLSYGENQRLHLRQIADNPYLRISNGESLTGELVFPGTIPADTEEISLIFNDGNEGSDISAPGLVVNVPLAAQ
jgi:hypothetical protein